MMKSIKFEKKALRLPIAIVFGLLISLVVVQAAYALNSTSNKAINVLGYNLLDNTSPTADQLKIYIDKSMNIDTNDYQFKVYDSNNNAVALSSVSTEAGNGISITEMQNIYPDSTITLPNGTTIVLTFSNQLSQDTLYTVKVSRAIRANNSLNIGEFLVDASGNKCDRIFKFKTKNSSNVYTGTPYVSYMPDEMTTANDVPVEGNIGFIVDRPVYGYDSVIDGMDLQVGGTSVVDTGTGGDCYDAMCVQSHTGFFFPLTYGTSVSAIYNLDYDTTYDFVVPSFYADDQQTQFAGKTYDFETTVADIPAKFVYAPTYSAGTLSWTGVTGANHYHVYVDTSKYWGNYSTPDYETSSTSMSFTPTSGTYVRIEAVDSNGDCNGLSNYLAQ